MAYNTIINPKTGKTLSIYGKEGSSLINGYLNYLIKNEPVLQVGGQPVGQPGVVNIINDGCDALHILGNRWRTEQFITEITEQLEYTDVLDNDGVAPANYVNLLKKALSVQPTATNAEKKFMALIIRTLIKMCPNEEMTLYKYSAENETYNSAVYTIETFNNEVGEIKVKETSPISEFHILTKARPELTDYPFKTINDYVKESIDKLSALILPKETSLDPNIVKEVAHMHELKVYLMDWGKHIAQEGVKLPSPQPE
tara:strand:+ start:145 stop:912 length:768 start_codon:yes stop_codon:yes gene_type:complete